MGAYYIFIDHAQHGPFSLEELKNRRLAPDTLVWNVRTKTWTPAGEVEELRPVFNGATAPPGSATGRRPTLRKRFKSMPGIRKGVSITIITLIVLGLASYINIRWSENAEKAHKQEIRRIHEVEVQKAIKELREERLRQQRQMSEQQRKEYIRKRTAELKSLKSELSSANARHRKALEDLDDVESFKLFRSRARKEEQVAAQLRTIRKIEDKITSLKERITKCQQDIAQVAAYSNADQD